MNHAGFAAFDKWPLLWLANICVPTKFQRQPRKPSI